LAIPLPEAPTFDAVTRESVLRPFLAGEIRLIDTIRHLVVPEMLKRVVRA
jgi:hypothetical protein